ncbi:hypothetical protein ACGFNU_29440 [Spirillospora sp. NPDC048911]|uniref:hypothetical protein n=1 Tax=Spirillospora sp. NPDC048911 TaxID=3364527 RepID=UPI00371CBA48
MVLRMIGGIALACAVALPMAGCGDDDKPDPKVAWAAKVCDGVKRNTKKVQAPSLDPRSAKKSRTAILTFLGDMNSQLSAQATSLSSAGSPPVGDTAYRTALANLSQVRTELTTVSASLEKAKVTDMKSLTRTLSSYSAKMSGFGAYQGPAKELRANADLNAAFGETPQCNGVGV